MCGVAQKGVIARPMFARRRSWSSFEDNREGSVNSHPRSTINLPFKDSVNLQDFDAKGFPILFVGVDPVISKAVVNVLERRGFQDLTLVKEKEAFNICKEKSARFGLVLIAPSKGSGLGHKVLESFKSTVIYENVPVIVLSPQAQDRQIGRLMELGASDVICPPIVSGHLVVRVETELRVLWLRLRQEAIMTCLTSSISKDHGKMRAQMQENRGDYLGMDRVSFNDFLEHIEPDDADLDDTDMQGFLADDLHIAQTVSLRASVLRKMGNAYSKVKLDNHMLKKKAAFLRMRLARANVQEKKLYRLQLTGKKEEDREEEEKEKTVEETAEEDLNIALQNAMKTPIEIVADQLAKMWKREDIPSEVRSDIEIIIESLASKDLFRPLFENLFGIDALDPMTQEWLADYFNEGPEVIENSTSSDELSIGVMMRHGSTGQQIEKSKIRSFGFNIFEDVGDDLLGGFVQQMFEDFDLFQQFNIKRDVFVLFLETLSESYERRNPYHNFRHACDVLHFVYLLLCQTDVMKYLRRIDVLALFIAALGHDVGHPGTTNPFHVNVATELALLYNDSSPLESHHCARLFQILTDKPTAILSNLSKEQFKELRKMVIHCILHTDAGTYHFSDLSRYSTHLDTGPFDRDNFDHRSLLCAVLLHSADISNQMRPWDIGLQWSERVRDEFFRQGDVEKIMGIPVSPFMDRQTPTFPKMNASFINVMVLPLCVSLSRLLEGMDEVLQNLRDNVAKWTEWQRSITDETPTTELPRSPTALDLSMSPMNVSFSKKIELVGAPGLNVKRRGGPPVPRMQVPRAFGSFISRSSTLELLHGKTRYNSIGKSRLKNSDSGSDAKTGAMTERANRTSSRKLLQSSHQKSSRGNLKQTGRVQSKKRLTKLSSLVRNAAPDVTISREREVEVRGKPASGLVPGDFVFVGDESNDDSTFGFGVSGSIKPSTNTTALPPITQFNFGTRPKSKQQKKKAMNLRGPRRTTAFAAVPVPADSVDQKGAPRGPMVPQPPSGPRGRAGMGRGRRVKVMARR